MNPYLERKRRLNEEAMGALDQAQPVASATVTNPYLTPPVQELEPEETPMQPQEDKPLWTKLLSLAPAAGMAVASLGGKGTAETRGQMNRYLEQATEQNAADTARAEGSVNKARAYNNDILARKQDRQRQKAQDTLEAEDRTRRIGKEDAETALAAQERDPASPKNRALQKSIAETYPGLLTPEELANFTTGDVEALTLSIKAKDRKQALQDEMTAERSKQKAERDFAIPGGGVGGSDYLERLAGGQPYQQQGTPQAPVPGAPPVSEPAPNPLVRDIADVYGGIDKVPPGMMARVRGALAASQAGATDKEMVALHQKLLDEAYKEQQDTTTRERQTRMEETAARKADASQDAQYSSQRQIRNIDKVRSRLMALKAALAKYRDKHGNLVGDIPGQGATGSLPKPAQLALTNEGRQIIKLKKQFLDTQIREATGAAASEGEVKQFSEMAGIGTWDTDQDLLDGIANAEGVLDQQEAFLNAAFPDASIRWRGQVAKDEAKKAEAKPTTQPKATGAANGRIQMDDGSTVADTPGNRKALGL